MLIFDNLKLLFQALEPFPARWAVCGGVAACLYRQEPRFTGDIDIILSESGDVSAKTLAEDVLNKLGFAPKLGFIPDRSGALQKGVALIIGRLENEEKFAGIDFLLPVQPWIPDAVVRAQCNLIDYAFARLPTITPEDLIIAKLFALESSPERPYDLDDINSMLKNDLKLDINYLKGAIEKFALKIPDHIALG